ncbi:capsular polysaccharide transport system permease protein [Paracoccus sanguinis]|uniref:Transport permease protein n=2 Tax=Paracoccus sanguinis TaxID=1545044 RepID=A0A1H2TAC0_9RHOB|nr:capsular polysaccharide transport system permease protein [Paracoccus sanguinis]
MTHQPTLPAARPAVPPPAAAVAAPSARPDTAANRPVGRARPAGNGLFRMARTVVALMLREISTTYGRSPGGYVWALADPILGITLLTIVFQGAMGHTRPLIGTNFPLFYASGYLVFQMYHDIANKVATSLRFSRPLLAYPAVTFVDALLARLILNVATHLVVVVVVIGGIALIYDLPLVMDVGTVLHALGLTALFAAGLGTLNCFLMMRFPVWERAWSILSRPLFLMSGVFYTYELMPNIVRDVLWWNPVLHLIGLMRRGIYVVYPADYVSERYVVTVSLILLASGLLLIWRRYRDLLEMV